MKFVLKDKVYVQNNDLSLLMRAMEGKNIPASIIDKVFGEVFICCDENRYDYVEFDQPEEIEFFKSLTYSVDYMSVKDLSEEDLIKVGSGILEQRNEIAKKWNSMSEEERKNNQDLYLECELLDFKALSIRDVIWFKNKTLKMPLPREVKRLENNGLRGFFSKFKR